jgi:hypothetical protein
LSFTVAIIQSGIKALVDLCTDPAGRQFRIPILVPVLALALVTTDSIFASGIPVTIVEIVCRALVGIQTLASSTGSIKANLARADIVDTHRVDKRSLTVCIGCTAIILLVVVVVVVVVVAVFCAVEESFRLGRWECTRRDAISLKIFVARANEAILECWRGRTGGVDMAWGWRLMTLVCRNALDGAPLDWHRINHQLCRFWEHSVISLTTTTFITFWWVVINAIGPFFGASGARVRRLGTFVDVLVTVATCIAIDAATHGLTSVGFYFARCMIHATVCLGQSFGTKEKVGWLLLLLLLLFISARPGGSVISFSAEEC